MSLMPILRTPRRLWLVCTKVNWTALLSPFSQSYHVADHTAARCRDLRRTLRDIGTKVPGQGTTHGRIGTHMRRRRVGPAIRGLGHEADQDQDRTVLMNVVDLLHTVGHRHPEMAIELVAGHSFTLYEVLFQ